MQLKNVMQQININVLLISIPSVSRSGLIRSLSPQASNPCFNNYCENGANCEPYLGAFYKCQCSTGWTGNFCELSSSGVTTVAPTAAPNSCTDCNELGTQYCSLLNGKATCNCKLGKSIVPIHVEEIITDICLLKNFIQYHAFL